MTEIFLETEKIKKLLDEYMNAVYKADIDKLKAIFHNNASMNGYLGESIVLGTPEVFYNDIISKLSMESLKTDCRYIIKDLEIEGNIAKATIFVDGFFGVVSIKDYLHLIKDKDSWKIISKTFTTL